MCCPMRHVLEKLLLVAQKKQQIWNLYPLLDLNKVFHLLLFYKGESKNLFAFTYAVMHH